MNRSVHGWLNRSAASERRISSFQMIRLRDRAVNRQPIQYPPRHAWPPAAGTVPLMARGGPPWHGAVFRGSGLTWTLRPSLRSSHGYQEPFRGRGRIGPARGWATRLRGLPLRFALRVAGWRRPDALPRRGQRRTDFAAARHPDAGLPVAQHDPDPERAWPGHRARHDQLRTIGPHRAPGPRRARRDAHAVHRGTGAGRPDAARTRPRACAT